jgi:hypothetical protein
VIALVLGLLEIPPELYAFLFGVGRPEGAFELARDSLPSGFGRGETDAV